MVTDEVMLTRVLRDVLSDGLKVTDAGEARLTVRHQRHAGRGWAVFTVTDTGIPGDQRERVFEEFHQATGAHQRGRSGTGLGLPYARKPTELLGGRLLLDSAPGAGPRVTVEVPCHPLASPPAPEEPVLGHLAVVVDDADFLATLRPVLGRVAERTTGITDSAAALPTLLASPPDGLLLDLFTPAPDGYRVLQRIAAEDTLRDLPVVVLTTADQSGTDRTRLGRARTVLNKTHLTAERLAAALGVPRVPGTDPDGDPPGEDGAPR